MTHINTTRWRVRCLAFLVAALSEAGTIVAAHADTFNFDGNPLPLNVYAFPNTPLNGAGAFADRINQGFRSAPYALRYIGFGGTPPTHAYKKLFDTNIFVSEATTLTYHIYPTNINSTCVAIDLQLEDGSFLRDLNLSNDAGVRMHPAWQCDHLQANVYNTVRVPLGALAGHYIKAILIGYDSVGPYTGNFEVRVDDVIIDDDRYVSFRGRNVSDVDGTPFAHSVSFVDPDGVGSTCGSTTDSQSVSPRACGGTVTNYRGRARVHARGYVGLSARIPSGMDALVSVCWNGDGQHNASFTCADHPAPSYCRPKQNSSTAKIYTIMPAVRPAYIDVRWLYVPEDRARGIADCDRGGFAKVTPVVELSANVDQGTSLGDVNGDDHVTVSDGVQVLRCVADLAECAPDIADVNCDDEITVSDGVQILRRAATLPVTFGCQPSWGGTGFGKAPPQHSVQVNMRFDTNEVAVPNYPSVKVDGIELTRPFFGGGLALDFAYRDGLSVGYHTLTIAPTSGFSIYMHGCTGCYNHPLQNFTFGNSLQFYYDGRTFVDVMILYFPSGRGVRQSAIGMHRDGSEEVLWTASTDNDAMLFESWKQTLAAVYSMPVAYLSAIANRYLGPRKVEAAAFTGGAWGNCRARGHAVTPSIHQLDGWTDVFENGTPVEQIVESYLKWQLATNASLVRSGSSGELFGGSYPDYPPGAFDGNSAMAIIGGDFEFPWPDGGTETMERRGIIGIALLWDEQGGLHDDEVVSYETFETDILLNYHEIVGFSVRTGDMAPGFGNLVTHELGHHLGLHHSGSPVMAQRDPVTITIGEFYPAPDDIQGLDALYPGCF